MGQEYIHRHCLTVEISKSILQELIKISQKLQGEDMDSASEEKIMTQKPSP